MGADGMRREEYRSFGRFWNDLQEYCGGGGELGEGAVSDFGV